jgi:hypothetical protein
MSLSPQPRQGHAIGFLAGIETAVPWKVLVAELEPFYPKPQSKGRGRPPIGLERMLRMYIAQRVLPRFHGHL